MLVEVRTMSARDWDVVRAIYLEGIASGQATFETQAPTWDEWNDKHLPAPRLIASEGDHVAGWAALSRVSVRAVYAGVAEVSVYVSASARGQGIGRLLLEALITESEQAGIWTLQAGIFPENTASISLHQGCGFRELGRRHRIAKLNGAWRDTVLLERRSEVAGVG